MKQAAVLSRPKERAPYQPFGGARRAWTSGHPEVLLCGPADTGKSRGIIEKLHYCADKYPNARILMVRKTRKSLGQTAMVTYEKKVLPHGWLGSLIHFNTTEQQYEYPNGSIIAVGGMDNPDKVLSSEWDMIYPQEATELSENAWETLSIRCRNGAMPYQQLIGDCNPGAPTHWLKRRCDRGATKYLVSRHADNPSITQERIERLKRLTGVRYKRYYLGLWAAAEGVVYEEWDEAIHKVSMAELKAWRVYHEDGVLNRQVIRHVIAGVDWGWKNAGVIGIYGIDGDQRMYLLREIYRSRRDINWWIEQGQRVQREFGIELFVCDPSMPAYISQFNGAGLNAIGAINDIAPGISCLRSRLKVQGDSRPRFFVYEYALEDMDELLDAENKPYCLEQEIDSYVYPQDKDGHPLKEVPVDEHNHALDEARYVTMHLDNGSNGIEALDEETRDALSGWIGY
jgi:hypothetical protein